MSLSKKLFFMFSILVMLVLVACSGDDETTSPSETDANNAQEDSTNDDTTNDDAEGTEEETEEVADYYQTPEMDFDLEGRVIKWVSWYDESIAEDNPDSIQIKENLDALMEKHNFEIEYVVVDYGEYRDQVTASLLAGQPLGDIIRMARPWMIPTLTQQDLFWPVDEYTDNENVFLEQYTHDYSQFEDRGYGFRSGILGASSGIFYNRTLMDSLGMKPLQEYVDEDNWNWETFMEVAKEANQDTNNDGDIDTWGLASAAMLVQALAANDANLVYEDQQGLEDPNTLETLNFLSELATEGIPRPTEGGDWTEPGQFFRQGNTLMVTGDDYQMNDYREDMPDYDVGFLPFPKGPNADGYRSHVTIPNYLTVPKAVEDPEKLLYIFEKMSDIDSIYDYPKQASLESLFSNIDDIENARVAGEVINVVDTENGYPSMPYYGFVDEILEGNSVSTVVESYRDEFQAAIDEVWGN